MCVTTRTDAQLLGTHLQLLYRYPSSHILFLLYFHFNLSNISLFYVFFDFIVSFLTLFSFWKYLPLGGDELTFVPTRTDAQLLGTHLQLLYRYPSSHNLSLLYSYFNLSNILLYYVPTRTHAHLPGTHLQLLYRYPSSYILSLLFFISFK